MRHKKFLFKYQCEKQIPVSKQRDNPVPNSHSWIMSVIHSVLYGGAFKSLNWNVRYCRQNWFWFLTRDFEKIYWFSFVISDLVMKQTISNLQSRRLSDCTPQNPKWNGELSYYPSVPWNIHVANSKKCSWYSRAGRKKWDIHVPVHTQFCWYVVNITNILHFRNTIPYLFTD